MRSLHWATALGLFPLLAATACGSNDSAASGAGTPAETGGGGGATSASTASALGGATASTVATGTGGAGGDPLGPPSETYPAPFLQPPQVAFYGGPVLASPKIVPVFFSGDDPTTVTAIEDFVAKIGTTAYWTAAVSEYGVGAAAGQPPVALTETAPVTIDDSAIQTWLQGKLNGDDPAWPPADANTVYVLHYPAGTTITIQGGESCTEFGGYHSNTALDATHGSIDVAYAVLPRCQGFDGMNVLEELTASESHELIEAATDPYPESRPAWAMVDDADLYWAFTLGGGEVGDMCAQFSGVFTQFPELDYVVQRSWSNRAALAGQDPCVPPLAGEVYFNAAPELDDRPTISLEGQDVMVKAVVIPVGQSKTIDLDLFSSASTNGPFSVHVDDGETIMGRPANLSFSVGSTPTIACPAGAPSGAVCVGGENGQDPADHHRLERRSPRLRELLGRVVPRRRPEREHLDWSRHELRRRRGYGQRSAWITSPPRR